MLELDKSGFDQTDIDIISVDIFDTVLLRDYSCGQRHFLESTTIGEAIESGRLCR